MAQSAQPVPNCPSPQAGDSEDVVWALETASAVWARGDIREALRWLRRAAESAADEGADARAAVLANAIADHLQSARLSSNPPPPSAPVRSHHSGIRRADERGRPRPPQSRLDDDDKTQVRAPSLMALARSVEDSFDELTPAYTSSPSEPAPPQTAAADPPSDALTRKLRTLREALVPLPPLGRPHESEGELVRSASEAASDTLPPEPPSVGSLAQSALLALPLDARRVAVLATPDGQAIVRPIGDGEAAPPGAQLALLVALDGGSRLFVARP